LTNQGSKQLVGNQVARCSREKVCSDGTILSFYIYIIKYTLVFIEILQKILNYDLRNQKTNHSIVYSKSTPNLP
jgi:hypothetical protein